MTVYSTSHVSVRITASAALPMVVAAWGVCFADPRSERLLQGSNPSQPERLCALALPVLVAGMLLYGGIELLLRAVVTASVNL